MVDADEAGMVHEGLCHTSMREGLGGATVLLALRAFRNKVLNDAHRDAVTRILLTEG